MGNLYSTILWDLDDTLLDFPYSQRYALRKCFHTVGLEITDEQVDCYSRINLDYWKRLELGEITREELRTGRFVTFFQECEISGIDVESFHREYEEALGSVYSFRDDGLEVVRTLRGKVRQYVITNGVSAIARSKIAISGLGEVMDGVFISEEIGCPKPQRAFFEYCLERIPEKDRLKILIVGDSLTSDIRGGVQAGVPSCWYRPSDRKNDTPWKPDHEISDLHEVYGLVTSSLTE